MIFHHLSKGRCKRQSNSMYKKPCQSNVDIDMIMAWFPHNEILSM